MFSNIGQRCEKRAEDAQAYRDFVVEVFSARTSSLSQSDSTNSKYRCAKCMRTRAQTAALPQVLEDDTMHFRMNQPPRLATDLLLDPFGADWQWVRATALAAEAAGFDGLWTWDHLMGSVHGAAHVLESWTLLTGLAAITQRVVIGPLTLNVANRHPGLLAMMAATLQQLSGGRLMLGIGAGGGPDTPYAAEQAAFARRTPGDAVRRRQVEEAVGVLRQVWTGRVRTRQAEYFPLGEGSGFVRPNPPPPIIIGAFGPKMAQLAGRVGDGINTQAQAPHLAQLLDIARGEHTASGRATPFHATVFAGFSERWLDEGRPERSRLRELGVERLILIVDPEVDTRRLTAGPPR